MITEVQCQVCRGRAFKNAAGQILKHTTPANGGTPTARGIGGYPTFADVYPPKYTSAEVCKGSTPGARP